MATLPTGWEWDYDGSRWLYRYKPTGHVQYHFPNAGDEFPDYIDARSPAPDLAPEERLESQQQVKRHASVSGTGRAEDRDGWRSRMSATAQPVSAVWEDDFGREDSHVEEPEEEEGVFQPENFMFLGPGAYTDVSPLNEEEEEAARRTVVGELKAGQSADTRGVSPMVSQNTTPMTRTTETVASGSTTVVDRRAVEPPPVMHHEEQTTLVSPQEYVMGGDIVGEASAPIDDGGYHYEMYELPVETAIPMHLQFDPVGFVAEMPTEHTASARVETHPDPIELADNYVMAPIETEPRPGYVELPVEFTPLEDGAVRQETLTEEQQLELRRQEVRRQQEERQRGVQQRQEERKRREEEELQRELQQQQQQQSEVQSPSQEQGNDVPNQFKIARKPTLRESSSAYNAYADRGQTQEDYQAYAPGQAFQQTVQLANALPARIMSPALQREASLNLSMRPSAESTPPVDRFPSVLKPARNSVVQQQQQQPPAPTPNTPVVPQKQNDAQLQDNSVPGVVKYPSVLRPARGKPGQAPEGQDATKGPEQGSNTDLSNRDARSSGYRLVAHGQHPPSMTPAPVPTPAPAPVPTPAPVVAQQIPPRNPPAPAQQSFGIATAQPPAPIQRPYTTEPGPSKSNLQIAQQYAAPPVPLKVAAQPPYPVESVTMPQPPIARTVTAPYPLDDGPPVAAPYGPLQSQQPMRPASAMPVLQHQSAGSAPGRPQQMPIRTGPPPPGSVIVPAGMAPRSATAGPAQYLQQQRRPSYPAEGDPRQNAVPAQNSQPPRPQSVANPGVYANFASHQSPAPQPRPVQRRATQDEILPVSPIRSRSESSSSGLPMETPSPLESRRGSANSSAYFASTPGSQSSSSVPPLNTALGRPPSQEPLQSPIHGGAPNPNGKQASASPVGSGHDRSKRHSMPQQQLANVMQGNSQGMASPQSQMQPSPDQRQAGVQRSQSLRQSRPGDVPIQNAPQSPTNMGPSSSSHLLTSIQEHDETQHAAAVAPLKVNQRKVLTKPPPFATPTSPLDKRGPQQQFVQGAPAPGPLQNQAQVPQNNQRPQMVSQMPPGNVPPLRQNVIQGQGIPVQQNAIQGQGMPLQQNIQGQGQGQGMPLQQNAIQGQRIPLQQNVIQGQGMSPPQAVAPPGQQMAYGQAPQMHIAPLSAPPLNQGGPMLQSGQIQTQVMPMQGLPAGQHAQPLPQQYHQQQMFPQTLPNSPSAAQPGPPPPLQTQQQTSPTSPKENRKSWGKWFKSSGSKSAAQSPVVQKPQHTFPPVPIPQPMPGANQSFHMQAGGQQYAMGFQGGQPAPMAQQQMQFQQGMPGGSTMHSRDTSDAASVSTISSDLKFLPSNNQAIGQASAHTNNDGSTQQFPNGMAPAPLFSGPSTPVKPVAASQDNKWAGKSPIDYSGGGWGDDDDDEY
ncbi:hypothetical protein H0G86_002068 [Trichoderma simmonsii]|uniref:WW domain-containing protein n=1 Tax=Trichoderma simmonsii TaxID=1491479 RepID=A0A8G0PBT4_9HYPO|nr:hypothetical protein H0G86_002068 [Trichoderma simmonsii]